MTPEWPVAPTSAEVCVGAVVIEGDRLLLVKRGRGAAVGQWSVPGGRVEPGESLAEALEREVAEETNLVVTCGPFIGWVERIGADHHFVIMDFWARLADGDHAGVERSPNAQSTVGGHDGPGSAGDDAAALAWVPTAELHRYELVDGLESFLRLHGVLT